MFAFKVRYCPDKYENSEAKWAGISKEMETASGVSRSTSATRKE
jgi:hypothetical protein